MGKIRWNNATLNTSAQHVRRIQQRKKCRRAATGRKCSVYARWKSCKGSGQAACTHPCSCVIVIVKCNVKCTCGHSAWRSSSLFAVKSDSKTNMHIRIDPNKRFYISSRCSWIFWLMCWTLRPTMPSLLHLGGDKKRSLKHSILNLLKTMYKIPVLCSEKGVGSGTRVHDRRLISDLPNEPLFESSWIYFSLLWCITSPEC